MSLSRQQQDDDACLFDALTDKHGITLSQATTRQLLAYRDLVVSWNDRVRLVSRADTGRILSRHVFESLLLSTHIPADTLRLADIGSGGGFPGIPVCLAIDQLQVTCQIGIQFLR